METVKTTISRLTDTVSIIAGIKEILQKIDAKYSAEEKAFEDATQALKDALGAEKAACVDSLIVAHDQRIASNLIFLIWNGLHLNLACFQNPVTKLFIKEDFEDFHQEHLMCSLPATIAAQHLIDKIYQDIPSELCNLVEPINSYFCYLETTAYKLVHYFGFQLADELLYWVVPGYAHDSRITCTYRMELSEYLDIKLT